MSRIDELTKMLDWLKSQGRILDYRLNYEEGDDDAVLSVRLLDPIKYLKLPSQRGTEC